MYTPGTRGRQSVNKNGSVAKVSVLLKLVIKLVLLKLVAKVSETSDTIKHLKTFTIFSLMKC